MHRNRATISYFVRQRFRRNIRKWRRAEQIRGKYYRVERQRTGDGFRKIIFAGYRHSTKHVRLRFRVPTGIVRIPREITEVRSGHCCWYERPWTRSDVVSERCCTKRPRGNVEIGGKLEKDLRRPGGVTSGRAWKNPGTRNEARRPHKNCPRVVERTRKAHGSSPKRILGQTRKAGESDNEGKQRRYDLAAPRTNRKPVYWRQPTTNNCATSG